MALLLDERTALMVGDLMLGDELLPVECRVTVEWLQGVAEPTWYGYFIPSDRGLRVLPGRYRIHLAGEVAVIVVRRACALDDEVCFPFWGLAAPPPLPADAAPALDTPLD